MTLSRFDSFHRSYSIKRLVVLFVLAIALVGTIPSYINGQWRWQNVPEVSHLKQLKAIQKNGLSLPGWQTLDQQTVEIGGHKWSAQAIIPAGATADQPAVWLLLRPQTWAQDLPQIDWTDINGVRQWTADSKKSLKFAVTSKDDGSQSHSIKADFLRGWTHRRTDAVLQWYAWPNSGHPAPSRWFWADQFQQLRHRRRLPWVAVSIQIPIKPLGEIATVQTEAETLGKLVQSTLINRVFQTGETVGQLHN
jgi:cyanoexosortase B-associated protein